jgi:HK97 family phage major capsid protein
MEAVMEKDELEMRFRPGGAVKALTNRRLMVLACPNGSPADRDRLKEFFSARTDFMMDVGDRRPLLYFHGFTPDKRMIAHPKPIGVGTATMRDEDGFWMVADLQDGSMEDRIWASAEVGTCRASTGAVNYLCRTSAQGEVLVWPIGELSLLDASLTRVPVSDKAIAIPLRASFAALDLIVPEAFGMDAEHEEEPGVNPPIRSFRGVIMPPEIDVQAAVQAAVQTALAAERKAVVDAEVAKVAMKAAVLDELKGDPKYRAMFATPKETVGKDGKPIPPDAQETHEFLWNLRHPKEAPSSYMGSRRDAMRGMEETEVTEAGPLVPADMLNRIWEIRDAKSLIRLAGVVPLKTDKLIFNIPAEVTPMIALATIAEEGAYIEDTPNLVTAPVTIQKWGGFVDVSEEVLEDQSLFQSWIISACGRAWALAENARLAVLLGAVNGVEIAVDQTPTDAEVMAWFYRLVQEYRQGATMFANDSTYAFFRSMVIANPRAYGNFGFRDDVPGNSPETFLGKPAFANAGWPTMAAAGDGVTVASFVNLPECLAWVEHTSGMSIKVDPYTKMVNGIVSYFPRVRFQGLIVQATAISNMENHV